MLFFVQYRHYIPGNPWIDWELATTYEQAAKIMRRAKATHTEGVPWRILVRLVTTEGEHHG